MFGILSLSDSSNGRINSKFLKTEFKWERVIHKIIKYLFLIPSICIFLKKSNRIRKIDEKQVWVGNRAGKIFKSNILIGGRQGGSGVHVLCHF